jgi:hypothetical protein
VSTTSITEPTDADLQFADLSVTIKQPQFQGGQSDEIETATLASAVKKSTTGLADNGTFNVFTQWR